MSKATKKVRDKWRVKEWYSVFTPSYFGEQNVANIPCEDNSQEPRVFNGLSTKPCQTRQHSKRWNIHRQHHRQVPNQGLHRRIQPRENQRLTGARSQAGHGQDRCGEGIEAYLFADVPRNGPRKNGIGRLQRSQESLSIKTRRRQKIQAAVHASEPRGTSKAARGRDTHSCSRNCSSIVREFDASIRQLWHPRQVRGLNHSRNGL